MDTLLDSSWRVYPAWVLIVFGAAMTVLGLGNELRGLRRATYDLEKALTIVRGFRLALVGPAVAG